MVFGVFVPRERLRWTDLVAFGLVFAGVAVSVFGREWASRASP